MKEDVLFAFALYNIIFTIYNYKIWKGNITIFNSVYLWEYLITDFTVMITILHNNGDSS